MKNSRAFTLIEVLVGLAIAALASAGVVGTYTYVQGQAHDKRVDADALTLNKAIDVYLVSGTAMPVDVSPRDVVMALKAVPDKALSREATALRALASSDTGISAYSEEDGRKRLVLQGGRFAVTTTGSGWILDKSGNVPVTEETRQIVGAKFASSSQWLWDFEASSAGARTTATGNGLDISLTSTATDMGGGTYRVTTPGRFTITAATSATLGVLSQRAGPYTSTIDISPGTQRITKEFSVGPGAKFTIYADATVSSAGQQMRSEIRVEVDISGNNSASPRSLAISGPDVVVVRKSEGTKTETYQYVLTFEDGTMEVGPISNAAMASFTYRTDLPTEVRVISESQRGLSATKSISIQYWRVVRVAVSSVGLGTAGVTSPNASGEYDAGTTIAATATPSPGNTFSGWSVGASGTDNPLNITVNDDTSLTATFAAAFYELNATALTGGTVSVTTPSSGTGPSGYPRFAAGTSVSISASAASDKVFDSWAGVDGGGVTGGAVGTILMNGNKTVIGTFRDAPRFYGLTVAVSDPAGGAPVGSTNGLSAGASAAVSVTLTPGWTIASASASSGATLSGSAGDNARTVTVGAADATVTYVLTPPKVAEPISRTLLAEPSPVEGGSVTGGGAFGDGSVAGLTASPASGWSFAGWGGPDGSAVSGGSNGAITPQSGTIVLNGNKHVVALFAQVMVAEPISRTLLAEPSPIEGGSVTGGGTFGDGAVAGVTASPAPGWSFAGWGGPDGSAVSGGSNGANTPQSGTIVLNGSKHVVALFSQVMVTSTWSAEATGGSGRYRITSIEVFRADNRSARVYAQENPGGNIASVTMTLPVGEYVIVARAEDDADPSISANVEAPLSIMAP